MGLRRTLAVVAGLYVIEGLPMGIFTDVWGIYLREAGFGLALIGALSGLRIAWAAKALWSPLVDRFGERQQWIAGALLVMAAALAAMPFVDPSSNLRWLWGILGIFCLAAATQDIAIDAYTIAIVDRGQEGPANAVRITGYRVALLLAGGGLPLLPRWIGWQGTHQVAALVFVGLAAALLAAPRAGVAVDRRRDVRGAFRSWVNRPHLVSVLLFVLLFRISDLAMAPMLKPFWVDAGLSREEIALVSTSVGFFATLAGAAAGGWIVAKVGIGRGLWIAGVFAVGSNLGYAATAFLGGGRPGIYAASLAESFCGGLAAASFMSFLMRICDRDHAAVQYATLTGLYALPGTLAGVASGWVAEHFGYGICFAATAIVAIPAFFFLPRARRWSGD